MISGRDAFKQLLKAHGKSVTAARTRVFEAMVGREPQTMHELVEQVRAADRASVYRAIDLFERLGIAQRLQSGWKYKLELTDKFNEHHHHLTCTNCGRTVAIGEDELEDIIGRLSAAHGFVPASHQIEVQGLCANCQALTRRVPGRP